MTGLGQAKRSLQLNFDFDTSAAPGLKADLERRLQHATDVFFSLSWGLHEDGVTDNHERVSKINEALKVSS